MSQFTIYTDGSCIPNPGPMGAAFVVLDTKDRIVTEGVESAARGTNNIGEYTAVVIALEAVRQLSKPEETSITIHTDSMLVINQIRGTWKVRDKVLAKFHAQACLLLAGFGEWNLVHVKAHNGDKWNEYVDTNARNAVKALL